MFWVISVTVLATSLILVVLQNFKMSAKVVERKVEHRHVVSDPQFRREMSVLLGPAIVHGNHVTDEASLNIYSSDFATQMTAVFEVDLLAAEPYSLANWKNRPLREKFSEMILLLIRSQL